MKRYRVIHTTGFKYTDEVVASYNEARMLPAKDAAQVVFSSRIEVKPDTTTHEHVDYFGTRVSNFEVLEHHRELTIVSQSLVEVRPAGQLVSGLDWSELVGIGEHDLALTDALTQTRRTEPPAEVIRLAKSHAKQHAPHQAAIAISRAVFEKMQYQSGVTGVHSIAKEAWANKIGVCQDYTHIVLGALRAVGIPARYVSGYFHPSKEPKLHEAVRGESHAWVEWFVGGDVNGGWYAFDPTNNIEVIDRHIVVGRGRDYDDLPPLRGVYAGDVASQLIVSVELIREA